MIILQITAGILIAQLIGFIFGLILSALGVN